LKTKPSSVLHSVAEHFHRDASDFAARFDALWEHGSLMHKMGRVKSFVDLLMACECSLKSHALLSMPEKTPFEAYRAVRACGHNIGKLAPLANYLKDRAPYEHLASQLVELPVHIRYSLEAYEAFFPTLVDRDQADKNYSATIGCNPWVLEIRKVLGTLLEGISEEFSGEVSMDLVELIDGEKAFAEFAAECLK
jgi:hypothetical protein